MAEQTAEQVSDASSELDDLESLVSETPAEDSSPPPTAAALDEVIAAEAEAPAPAEAGDAGAGSAATPAADQEIEEFLAAAAAGQTPADSDAEPAAAEPEAAPASDETPDADAPPAEPRTPLVRRLLSLIGRMLETILVWVDAPVATLREDIKALIGYLAVATAAMAGVTWLIVLLR